MKHLRLSALVLVFLASCTSTQHGATTPVVTPSPLVATDVEFGSFIIENTTGISMNVTLEAPIGTIAVGPTEVKPNTTAPFVPGVKNVSSAKIIADFGSDHGAYTETVTVTGQGVPVYVEQMAAAARIGDVTITALKGSHARPN